ncbi:MAG: hypothetical protein K0S04_4073, partial [Herbinix sp.]|nr:hypothetical protein [Herbinix sp.]
LLSDHKDNIIINNFLSWYRGIRTYDKDMAYYGGHVLILSITYSLMIA